MMFHRFRPRLTYANVTSSIAMFVALCGGVAWAGATIGTKDLENRAVTTKKVKKQAVKAPLIARNAVQPRVIAPGAVKSKAIAPGAVTPPALSPELRDELAPQAPKIQEATTSQPPNDLPFGETYPFLARQLSPGTHVATAKLSARNHHGSTNTSIRCRLRLGTTTLDLLDVPLSAGGAVTIPLQSVFEVESGQPIVSVDCRKQHDVQVSIGDSPRLTTVSFTNPG